MHDRLPATWDEMDPVMWEYINLGQRIERAIGPNGPVSARALASADPPTENALLEALLALLLRRREVWARIREVARSVGDADTGAYTGAPIEL